MNHSIIIAKNIQLAHDENILSTHPFSFELPENNLISLIGPNGAGKTTLLRSLIGEIHPSAGELIVHTDRIGFVTQEQPFVGLLTVDYVLSLAFLPEMGLIRKLPAHASQEIHEILEAFDLIRYRHHLISKLSTGEKQKVFLARALLQKPKLLILDEPTNHLDPGATERFWNYLGRYRKQTPLSILVSTHDLSFIKEHSQQILAMRSGVPVYVGPRENFNDWNSLYSESSVL